MDSNPSSSARLATVAMSMGFPIIGGYGYAYLDVCHSAAPLFVLGAIAWGSRPLVHWRKGRRLHDFALVPEQPLVGQHGPVGVPQRLASAGTRAPSRSLYAQRWYHLLSRAHFRVPRSHQGRVLLPVFDGTRTSAGPHGVCRRGRRSRCASRRCSPIAGSPRGLHEGRRGHDLHLDVHGQVVRPAEATRVPGRLPSRTLARCARSS